MSSQLLSVASHVDTSATTPNPAYSSGFSVSGMVKNSWEYVKSNVSDAYNWTKEEVKGAADYTTDKTSSLLWTVAIAGAVVLLLYMTFKREVMG